MRTRGALRQLLTRNRKAVRCADRTPFSPAEREIYERGLGIDAMRRYIRGRYFYWHPALVRIVLELVFGEAAAVYEDADALLTREP